MYNSFKDKVSRVWIIIYNFCSGKFRKFYLINGSYHQFSIQTSRAQRGMFYSRIGRTQFWSYTSFKIKMWYLKLRKVSCPKGVVKLINLTFPCWKNRRSVMLLKISNLMVREMNLCIILSKEFKNSLLTIFIRKLTTHPMR